MKHLFIFGVLFVLLAGCGGAGADGYYNDTNTPDHTAQANPPTPQLTTPAHTRHPKWSTTGVTGTPKETIRKINRETATILATPEMRAKLAEQGAEAVGGAPEQFAGHIRAEREKWSRLIRERNIVVN